MSLSQLTTLVLVAAFVSVAIGIVVAAARTARYTAPTRPPVGRHYRRSRAS